MKTKIMLTSLFLISLLIVTGCAISQNLRNMPVEDRMFFELEAAAETVNDITAAIKASDMEEDEKDLFFKNIDHFWQLYEVTVHARSAYIKGDVDAQYALREMEKMLLQKYGLEDMYENR